MIGTPRLRRAAPLVLAAMLAAMTGGLAPHGVVHAHTDFDYSMPTDGASVVEPLGEITIAFTLPVTLVGNGFEVLDPQNNVLAPVAVSDDDTVFRLQFDPPLAGGTVAVRYEVRAEDGHVLDGNVVFTVDASVPATASPSTEPPISSAAESAEEPDGTTTAETPATTSAPMTAPPASGGDDGVAGESVAAAQVSGAEAPEVQTAALGDEPVGETNPRSGVVMAIAITLAVAVGAGGFLLVRSRTSGAA